MDLNRNGFSFDELKKEKWFWPVVIFAIAFILLIVLNVINNNIKASQEQSVSSKKNSVSSGITTSIVNTGQTVSYTGSTGTWSTFSSNLDAFKSKNTSYTLLMTTYNVSNNVRHYELYSGTEPNMSNYTNYISDLSFDVTSASNLGTSNVTSFKIQFANDNKTKPTSKEVTVYLSLLDYALKGIYPDADSSTLAAIKKDLAIPSVTDYINIKISKSDFVAGVDFMSGTNNSNVSTFTYSKSNNIFTYEYRSAE
jgi:hypothetical protein